MNEKLDFYTSYGSIDIWQEQNTKTGIIKYMFWFMGRTYESTDNIDILNQAKTLINKEAGRVR